MLESQRGEVVKARPVPRFEHVGDRSAELFVVKLEREPDRHARHARDSRTIPGRLAAGRQPFAAAGLVPDAGTATVAVVADSTVVGRYDRVVWTLDAAASAFALLDCDCYGSVVWDRVRVRPPARGPRPAAIG